MHFSKTIGLAFATATIAGSAFAADLPSRRVAPAPVMAAPMFTWTGFYVGLNAGYSWSANNNVGLPSLDTNPVIPANFGVLSQQVNSAYPTAMTSSANGFLGGGQIGYNWQFGAMVAGLEADIHASTAKATSSSWLQNTVWFGVGGFAPYGGGGTVSRSLDWLGTVRGRLGFSVAPTFLLYATGGLAYGGTKLSYTSFSHTSFGGIMLGAASSSTTSVGYTVGAGAEWAFNNNWSIKAEYLYYDLGRQSVSNFSCLTPGAPGNCSLATATVRNNGHIVRTGVNYRFNWGSAPVVAKY